MGVAVLGVGFCGSFPTSSGMSYRELTARAARMAYQDAGITASQLEGAVVAEEDLSSGYSICDEYTPDQLGVVRKSVYTVCGDFLHALASAVMQVGTGQFSCLAVSAYSKASNVLNKDEVLNFAYDPTLGRLGVTPHYLAGIEMRHVLESAGACPDSVAEVVVRARSRAMGNPLAPWGALLDVQQVLEARKVADPLTELMIASPADAAVVAVVGSDELASGARKPVAVTGTGWASGTIAPETRDHTQSVGSALAARAAFAEAGISGACEADVVYVSDLYPHRQLMHVAALGAGDCACAGPVNPDGGSLGMGDLFEANGGARLFDAVRQLRGEAGAHQVNGAKRAVVHGWRGLPTDTCAVVVLDAGRAA